MALRLQQANLHGYASYSDYALADTMAGSKEAVAGLLKEVWGPALKRAGDERAALQALADAEAAGRGAPANAVTPADWRYLPRKCARRAMTSMMPPSNLTSRWSASLRPCSTARNACSAYASPRAPIWAGYHPGREGL